MTDLERVRADLLATRQRGTNQVVTGLVSVAVSPVLLIAGGLFTMLLPGAYQLVGALATVALATAAILRGSVSMIRGGMTITRATRELVAIERPHLPEARVIER